MKSAEGLSDSQREVWRMSQKLHSIGVLLERQGEEHEGFTELAGLGLILVEYGERLETVSTTLDEHLVREYK